MTVDVGTAAPSEGLASRGGGLEDHVGQLFHGAEKLLAWIGWQSCVASVARLSARSTRLRGGGVTFRPGPRPRILVFGRGLRAVFLCRLGCGWLCRAALWLDYERWYVGTAVPEGGLSAPQPCTMWAMCIVW
jgi:hypothetical protein